MAFTNQLKKYVRSLHLSKYRQKYNKFIAEGPKICKEFIEIGSHEIEYVMATQDWINENQISLKNVVNHRVLTLKKKELESISLLKSSSDVLIIAELKTYIDDIAPDKWGIYVEKLQDPGNMGTILRIADWYGVEAVLSSEDSVHFYHPKVVQSAMGAHNRVAFGVKPLSALAAAGDKRADMGSRPLYGMSLDGQNINELTESQPGLIIIGNESKGLSIESKKLITHSCMIPRIGGAESLNAAVACGIACHQLMTFTP